MDLLSVNEYGSYAIPDGDDYEYPGGFSKLIHFLAEQLPISRIKLNHPVINIRQDSIDPDILLVQCSNGKIFKTKHVVVTVPLNYLKKHFRTLFESNLLNDKKLESIEKVKMDTVDKLFLFYNDMSFYPADTNSLHPLFFDESKYKQTETTIDQNWIYKTYSYDKFYDHMLIVWMTGEEADYVEKLSDDEVSEKLTELLRKFLKNPNVPLPDKIVRTKWSLNPYILGKFLFRIKQFYHFFIYILNNLRWIQLCRVGWFS